VLAQEIGVLACGGLQIREHDALGGHLRGKCVRSRAPSRRCELLEVEAAHVHVPPLFAFGVGKLEFLEEVERFKPTIGDPGRLVEGLGQATYGVPGEL
jgi:hypothetical protein